MKLNEIQQQLKVPKTHRNSFANYDYRNAEDILEAIKPLLGTSILYLTDEPVMVGDWHYIKATATLTDETTTYTVSAYAREPLEKKGSDVSQITGAASSYARKYALNGLFCIDDTKDADSTENAVEAKKEPIKASLQKPKAVESSRNAKAKIIKDMIDLTVLDPLETKEEYGKYVLEQTGLVLEENNFDQIIAALK